MTRLADLIPFSTITPGGLFVALEEARPDLMAWSRSGDGSLSPRQLADLVLGALPAAFSATVQEAAGNDSSGQTVVNEPSIELLDPAGAVRWTLTFKLQLMPPLEGQRPQEIRLSVVGSDGRPVKIISQSVGGS